MNRRTWITRAFRWFIFGEPTFVWFLLILLLQVSIILGGTWLFRFLGVIR